MSVRRGGIRTAAWLAAGAALAAVILRIFFEGSGDAGDDDAAAAAPEAIVALVAASTTDAVAEIASQFTADTGIAVRLSAGPSNQLAQQILHGAPAAVYLSASPTWADAVQDAGLARGRQIIAANRLVLIVPQAPAARGRGGRAIDAPDDLLRPGLRVALADEHVPAGMYARQALEALGLLDALQAGQQVIRGSDVRATLAYVQRGEVDAGIVYATDARLSQAVRVVHTFSASLHQPITYSLLLLSDAPAGRAFFERLSGADAREILSRHGFVSARDAAAAGRAPAPSVR